MKNFLSRLDLSYLYSFISEATLGLTFVFYLLIARIFGPEQYGVFSAAIALGGVLSVFIQFGLPTLLVRDVSANPVEGPKSLLPFLLIEGLNSVLILCFLFPLSQLFGFEGVGIAICYLVLLSECFRSVKQTLRSVFRGLGKFRTEALSVAIERFSAVFIAGIVLFSTRNLVWVMTTLVFVRLIDNVGALFYLSKKTKVFSSFRLPRLWSSLKIAYPFAISGVLWILYYQVDILMLKVLAPTEEVGFYGAAYRVLEIFSALPRVIFLVAFTKFSKCFVNEPERLPNEIHKTVKLLLIGVLPILIIAGFLQVTVINTLYGDAFASSVNSLSILLPSLAIKSFGSLFEYFFQATGREKILPPLLLVTVLFNVGSNIILIPHLGAIGAALSTLLSEIILALVGFGILIHLGYRDIGQRACLLAFLSLLMASIPSLMLYNLQPIIGIGILAASFFAIIVIMNSRHSLSHS